MGRRVDNTYTNPFGKKRDIQPGAESESEKRRQAFASIEPELKRRLAEKGVTNVVFEITGSVKENAAQPDSDIDVMVASYKSDKGEPVTLALIRQAVTKLKDEHTIPYHISISAKGQPMANALKFQAKLRALSKH